jgi:hypothetical protein
MLQLMLVELGLQPGLVALDLGPLLCLPLRDLDVGLGFQALDLGIGRGRLLGDLDLRHGDGDAGILGRLRRLGRRLAGRSHPLGRLEETSRAT